MSNTLASQFNVLLKEAAQDQVIVFLVDGSGSVNSDDFNGPLKQSLSVLISKFNANTSVGVLQFAGEFRWESNITKNLLAASTAVNCEPTPFFSLSSSNNTTIYLPFFARQRCASCSQAPRHLRVCKRP